jgi:hypothetical protein
MTTLDEHPECPIVPQDPFCWGLYWGCVDLVPGETCETLCRNGDCVIDWWTCDGTNGVPQRRLRRGLCPQRRSAISNWFS